MEHIARLKVLLGYFEMTKGVGHTKACLEGVKNTQGAKILCANMQHATDINTSLGSNYTIPLSQVTPKGLAGRRDPLVIDNYAFLTLGHGIIEDIKELEIEWNERYRKTRYEWETARARELEAKETIEKLRKELKEVKAV